MSEIFRLDGVQTLKRKEKKKAEAAALRHSGLSWKKKWDLKKFVGRMGAECFLRALPGSLRLQYLCRAMFLTHDGCETKDLFLELLKHPHLRCYSLAHVCNLLEGREALFLHLSCGAARTG